LLVATMLAPPSEPAPAPGGYWSTSEQRERRGEPPDGEDELTVGSVLFSLGFLRLGAAGVSIWMARTPGKCPVTDPAGCRPYEIYGWAGFGEGGLMVGTGLTYLIIGAIHRERHDRWSGGERVRLSRGRALVQRRLEVGPWVIAPRWLDQPLGGGAQLRLRF
jgi:hypothetical protein